MRHSSGSSTENTNDNLRKTNELINNGNDDVFVIKQSTTKSRSVQRQTKRPPSERRFKCDQCERMFFTRKDVKRHLVVHTGIRNFACPFCTQRFGRKDHLVRHAKKSHNKDTRSCAAKSNNNTNINNNNDHNDNDNDTNNNSNKSTSQTLPLNNNNNKPTTLTSLIQKNSHTINVSNKNTSFNYIDSQTVDHSLTLFANTNEHPNQNGNYLTNHNSINTNVINNLSTDESFYGHSIMNNIKTEPISSHHYLAFPVNTTTYHHTTFIPGCFVSNATDNLNPCNNPPVTTFGLPVTVCGGAQVNSNGIHGLTVDVNPSLPHFNQAFQ